MSRTPTGSASAVLTPPGDTTRVREFWTLVKRDGHWILQSIEQGAEGAHRLREGVVATPWGDEQALRDEALVEGAVQDAVPDGTKLAEVADLDFEGDGRAAALDLSLADGRFAPDVLEVAARRAVAAWVDAVDGDDGPLLALSRSRRRARAAASQRPERAHTPGRARPRRASHLDRLARRRVRARDDDDRRRARRPALPRGSRHRRGRVRKPVASGQVHRTLDARARRTRRAALADNSRRRARRTTLDASAAPPKPPPKPSARYGPLSLAAALRETITDALC